MDQVVDQDMSVVVGYMEVVMIEANKQVVGVDWWAIDID